MAEETRGNDAIPSWSGFNYQGKVMLLYVLCKMNEIIANQGSFEDYCVELEEHEDFVIKKNDKSESFHQVKATLSKSKWRTYSVALDKLLEHRNISDNPVANCYFIVAREIEDWHDLANSYKTDITLYKYKNKIIDVMEVSGHIIGEIKKIVSILNLEEGKEDIIYGELCIFLHEWLAKMHKRGAKKREYKITFSDFYNIILKALQKVRVAEEYFLKEKVYEYSVQEVQQALEEICTHRCGLELQKCSQSCAAKEAYQRMLGLPDLVRYCKVINPSKIKGWDDQLQLVEYMSRDKLEDNIFRLFYESKNTNLVDSNVDAIYMHTKRGTDAKVCVIPTLLDLSKYFKRGEKSLQDTFQAIKNNKEIVNILDGNAITAVTRTYEGMLSQLQIANEWNKENPESINNFEQGLEIISLEEMIERFRMEGGNNA